MVAAATMPLGETLPPEERAQVPKPNGLVRGP